MDRQVIRGSREEESILPSTHFASLSDLISRTISDITGFTASLPKRMTLGSSLEVTKLKASPPLSDS